MKLVVTIECANAAFGEVEITCGEEAARILRVAAQELEENGPAECNGYRLYDANGNRVGNIVVED